MTGAEDKSKVNAKQQRREKALQEAKQLEDKSNHPENYVQAKYFADLPLTTRTQNGLKKANFRQLTVIQRKAIPLALAKRDVLGAAKTGSGKTLSFLVPVLEILHREQWNTEDGLGALIISPTRELAVQIFEVLKKIGREHAFSAGLIIGGKDFKVEQERVTRMNILVATPGRLLQHMDQSAGFNCDNLQVLVLDEADRIMDMGFQKTVNAIVENLPRHRQTLLFSATQTRSVKDLARLSLKDPEYVAVHEKAEFSTPQNLTQHYVVAELPKKLDILYSFVKSHLKSKTIVFVSSCKQARFIYEAFCKLQPGVPILHLHGKQKQTKRVDIFRSFTTSQHAVLICTDIAARGLDFPAVDWVIQLDCPEDPETYIHRVGRTARFDAEGHALLILLPTEAESMVEELKKKRVPIEEIKIKASKQQSIQKQLQSFCFNDPEIKYLGQRAFVAYMRSVYLQRNKNIFKAAELPADDFAHSLGLAGAPKIKFIKKGEVKASSKADKTNEEINKKVAEAKEDESDESEEESEEESSKTNATKTKYDRMFQRKNQGILSEHYNKLVDYAGDKMDVDDNDNDDDFMKLERVDHALSDSDEDIKEADQANMSKRQAKMSKKELAKKMSKGERLVFDEEGKPHQLYEMQDEKSFLAAGDAKTQISQFISETGELMKEADKDDKKMASQKRREKKMKKKLSEEKQRRQQAMSEDEGESGSESDEEASESESGSGSSGSESESDSEEEVPKKRKWYEEEPESEEDEATKKRIIETDAPETLQDQEALALRLLGM